MDIKEQFPPNIAEIKQYFDVDEYKPFFAYSQTLYNPYKQVIPPDIEFHEGVHSKQQGDKPELWWTRYLLDRAFRQEQEVAAYALQWMWVKQYIPKASQEALEEFAEILASPMYDLGLSKHQCQTLIRLYK